MTVWHVDAAHSYVGFSVRHMMISKVHGNFTQLEGTVEGDPNKLADTKINFKIDVNSINTNNEDRDNHLRSDDFFNSEKYPEITFSSTKIKEIDEDAYAVIGDLTIQDHTHETTFNIKKTGEATNPWGVTVIGFEGETEISRKQFGLTWNQTLETGGVVVSDEVKISLNIEVNPKDE